MNSGQTRNVAEANILTNWSQCFCTDEDKSTCQYGSSSISCSTVVNVTPKYCLHTEYSGRVAFTLISIMAGHCKYSQALFIFFYAHK